MRSTKKYPALTVFPNLKRLPGPTCYLNSNNIDHASFLALGEIDRCSISQGGEAFPSLRSIHQKSEDWLFGHLSYDLKQETEHLVSENPDGIEAPLMFFFQPEVVFRFTAEGTEAHYHPSITPSSQVDDYFDKLSIPYIPEEGDTTFPQPSPRITKDAYLETLSKIKEHIQQGDIYEVNYCQEFLLEDITLDPLSTYYRLNELSQAPFSVYYQFDDIHLLSGSPERFLKKEGDQVTAQPIKGTMKRGATPEEDEKLKEQLRKDPKERAENIMIVDLVRNDLSRNAAKGSVKVEELCGIQQFETVHQMISTISAKIREGKHFTEVIRDAFPMGSMTGTPKVKAMELIERYEKNRRGVYSGSVGYITPKGDFDLNVVIRSLLYNSSNRYLSFQVGGAITARSLAEKEYEECLLKAEALKKVFTL